MGEGITRIMVAVTVRGSTPIDHDSSVQPGGVDLAELFRLRWLPMVRLATLLTGSVPAAEDVVSDAFASVSKHLHELTDLSSASAYLRTSVVNGTRSAHRSRIRAAKRPWPAPGVADAADAGVLLAEEHREVLAAIERLPRRQREVLVLRYWNDASEAEIARTLGISAGTVKSTASRALAAVSRMLGEANGAGDVH